VAQSPVKSVALRHGPQPKTTKGDPMISLTRLGVLAAVVLAGCATQPPSVGRHLVYRDSAGHPIRQFDYPDDAFCRRVAGMAGGSAHCQVEPAAGLTAHATLRYNPPGVLVEGHYADLERCRIDNSRMSGGVELVSACSTR
jgi:hypothetical protein